jgi:hypothetical protein
MTTSKSLRIVFGLVLIFVAVVLALVALVAGLFAWPSLKSALAGRETAEAAAYAWGQATGAAIVPTIAGVLAVVSLVGGVRRLLPRATHRVPLGGEWLTGEFRIEPAGRNDEPEGHLRFHIQRGSRLVARYWHDHRGEDHGIEFVAGGAESRPVGRVSEFIETDANGAPVLSKRAVAWLEAKARALHAGDGG